MTNPVLIFTHAGSDALDRSRSLEILKGYGVGERVHRMLREYWERMTMVARAGSYYGKGFKGERGVTP